MEPLATAVLLIGYVDYGFDRLFRSYAAVDSRIPLSASEATSTSLE